MVTDELPAEAPGWRPDWVAAVRAAAANARDLRMARDIAASFADIPPAWTLSSLPVERLDPAFRRAALPRLLAGVAIDEGERLLLRGGALARHAAAAAAHGLIRRDRTVLWASVHAIADHLDGVRGAARARAALHAELLILDAWEVARDQDLRRVTEILVTRGPRALWVLADAALDRWAERRGPPASTAVRALGRLTVIDAGRGG